MKGTVKNLISGVTLALALAGCEKETKELDKKLPALSYNQTEWEQASRFANPNNILENQKIRRTYGTNSSSYELLTDLDSNGSWDVLERKACGYNGQADYGCQHVFYVKRGFSILESIAKEPIRARTENSIIPKTEINFTEDSFFRPYQ